MAKRLHTRILEGVARHSAHRLLPFHRRWVRDVFQPDVEVGVLSCPRGSAKTWMAAQLAALAMRPGSALWQPPREVLAVSGSLEQSRVLLAMVKEALADVEHHYRWLQSGQRLACTHKATGVRLRVLSSSGRRAMGLATFSTIFADEPGSWQKREGALLYDALRQSLGKMPGQRLVLIGTRAPSESDTWWPNLIDAGSGPGVHVSELRAPRGAPWDAWPTIRKCNPLAGVNASLRRTILRERDEARKNPTARASFRAYRLNQRGVSVSDDSLVSLSDWQAVERRKLAPRKGRPVVGLDMGGNRSWSAAWCLWPNGRSEAYAVVPGIPSLEERERQDAQPRGLYQKLEADGVLVVDQGVRVSSPSVLVAHLVRKGIRPRGMVCDRFLAGAVEDAVRGRWPILFRRTRWTEATEDVAAFQKAVKDGPLSLLPACRKLVAVSLGGAVVRTDDQGSTRLVKRASYRSRDDVAVAGVLACGQAARLRARPRRKLRSALAG